MTKSFKTSEFWLIVAANVVYMLLAAGWIGEGSTLETVLGFAASALTAMGYTYGRSMVKSYNSDPLVLTSKPADE